MDRIDPPGAPADLSAGISLDRAFGTWSSDHPLAMIWLPLGLSLTPIAYAASTGMVTDFPAGPALRLGRHTPSSDLVEAGLTHAGTTIDWRYDKADNHTVHGSWQTTSHGEWGLRFWICLGLGSQDGRDWHWNAETGAATIRIGHRYGIVVTDPAPLLITGHETLPALCDDMQRNGYFHLASRTDGAALLALRFNLEEAPSAHFGFAIGDDWDETLARARCALAAPPKAATTPENMDKAQGALQAVCDVMAWNTLFDPVNHRAYTALSRNWTTAKFGGFGVWLNDVLFSSLLCGLLDGRSARDNLVAVLAGATPQGNLPCLLTGNDAWIDRSQPPISAYVLRQHLARWPDRALLEQAVPVLLRAYDWWWRARDPQGAGLVRYGTSAVGAGLYRGTKLGAKDESAMDNSPTHDEAALDKATGLLDSYDVGLNALLALEGEMLAALLTDLGDTANAERVAQLCATHKEAIRTRLWDDSRGVFANRLTNGRFVRSLAPTSFYPLLAGIPTAAQTDALLVQLRDPQGFGGAFSLPSVRRDDPAFGDNIYWRGRVWPPMNWFTWAGLRRAGRDAEAANLAAHSLALFSGPWQAQRQAAENFSAVTGEATDQPDTDTFYAWSALMPAMALAEIVDISPWDGFTLTNAADTDLGPVATPCGLCRITVANGVLRLTQRDALRFETDIPGRVRHLRLSTDRVSLHLPLSAPAGRIKLPSQTEPLRATQGGTAIKAVLADGQLSLHTRAVISDADRVIDVVLP